MKSLLVFLCLATAARAAAVGDTYEQVVTEKGKPTSQVIAGTNRVLNYPDATIQLHDNVVVSVKVAKAPAPKETSSPKEPPPKEEPRLAQQRIVSLQNERLAAINSVKVIVNQPVRIIQRTKAMKVSTFHPGWFHDGAITPDFNTVDVRATQEVTYDRYAYVTSDLNPGVAFVGHEIEFNPMTKYFYEDRSLPKKKLSQSEMEEINRLYRIIGRCDDQLRALQKP